MLHGTGGREYIIGWIDAQILAEGLPAVVSVLEMLCCCFMVFFCVVVVLCTKTSCCVALHYPSILCFNTVHSNFVLPSPFLILYRW